MKENCLSKNVLWHGGLFLVISIITMLLSKLLPYPIFLIKDGIIETLLIFGGIFILQKNNFEDTKTNVGKVLVSSILATIIFYVLEWLVAFVFNFIFGIFPTSSVIIVILNIITTLITYFLWFFIYITLCKIIFKPDNRYIALKKNIVISLIVLIIFSLVAGIIYSISQIIALQMLAQISNDGNEMGFILGIMEMSSGWDLTYLIILVKSVIMAILSLGFMKQSSAD